MMMAGEAPGDQVVIPPALVTKDALDENDVGDMDELAAELSSFAHADVAMTDWMPLADR